MNASLRSIVLGALEHWGCLHRELEPNRLLVFIPPGSPLERICERSGEVSIALSEFEGATAEQGERFDFVPGSIYLTRLLRELQAGPAAGSWEVVGLYPFPTPQALVPLLRDCLSEPVEIEDCEGGPLALRTALTFHFVLLLRGLHFVEHFFSVAVDVESGRPLQLLAPETAHAPTPALLDFSQAGKCYEIAVQEARVRILEYLALYRKGAAPETEQTIRTIQRLLRQEIEEVRRRAGWARTEDIEVECDRIRENAQREIESVRQQGWARSADLSLVAVTCERRPAAEYRVRLRLPGDRVRTVIWIFDRATGNLHPPACEGCGRPATFLHPGEPPCFHLLCKECQPGVCGRHAICLQCSSHCDVCKKTTCRLCVPQAEGCEHTLCIRHITKCSDPNCGEPACPKCLPRCFRCRKRVCRQHLIQCPLCEKFVCSDHIQFGQHGQRCDRKWMKLRSSLLLDLVNDCLSYDFDGMRERMLGQEGFDVVDVDLLDQILRRYLGHQEGVRAWIRAWFQPLELSLDDEDRILENFQHLGLEHLELEDDFSLPSPSDASEVTPTAGILLGNPLIAEYGAWPAMPGAGEKAYLQADTWLSLANDHVPWFDEEVARSASVLDVPDSDSPFEALVQADLKELVQRTLKTLTPREELVLKMRFGFAGGGEHTIEAVSRSFNVAAERIRQIESKALRKLRHPSRALRLRGFLE